MYFETWIGMIVSLVLFPIFYFYAVRPADSRFNNALIEQGVIKHRDPQLFMQQTHSFYSRKITSLNAISEKLVEQPFILPKTPCGPFQNTTKVEQEIYPDLIIITVKNVSRKAIFSLKSLGEYNGEYVYEFSLETLKKRGFKETAFVYNFILTRIETILKQLDDNVEVERKVIDYTSSRK